jgi:anaerobic selenocysteine-containing dehydrogenase
MVFTRRDVLFGLGGGIAGATLSPLPWKLLDDAAIWTQRRHALPLPARGALRVEPYACTLCPGGCALRVRLVGTRPVAVSGESAHPLGGSACPIGLTLHHLPYHPLRLRGPAVRRGARLEPASAAEAVDQVAAAIRDTGARGLRTVVLDRRPGRAASIAWRELAAALPRGLYATRPGEDATFERIQRSLAEHAPVGLDLDRTRTLVSFGAPVLEGWGRPARMLTARRSLRVIQLDAWRSPTAALADEWIPIAPGSEGPLALALAHVVARERALTLPPETSAALAAFPPARVAHRAGLEAGRIEALARTLLHDGPAVAIGGGEPGAGPLPADAEQAIALLDVLLGSVGREGGFVARRALPEPSSRPLAPAVALSDVPAGSVGVLLLDAGDDGRALPAALLEPLLARDALVVSLAPFDGGLARRADVLLPAPPPLETWDEVLPTADADRASWSVARPVLAPFEGAVEPVELAGRLAQALGARLEPATHEQRLRERARLLLASRRGRVVARADGEYEDAAIDEPDALFSALAAGGVWIDDAPSAGALHARPEPPTAAALRRWTAPEPAGSGLPLVAFAARATAGTTPPSPLLTKLYQESDLRPPATVALLHPDTASALGLAERQPVTVESPAGSVSVAVRLDATLPAGRVAVAAGPSPALLRGRAEGAPGGALAAATLEADGTWRETRVRVREA